MDYDRLASETFPINDNIPVSPTLLATRKAKSKRITFWVVAGGSSSCGTSLSEDSPDELDELSSSDEDADNCTSLEVWDLSLCALYREVATRGDSCCLLPVGAADVREGKGEILPLSFGLSLTSLENADDGAFDVLTRFSCIVLVTLSSVIS